MKVFKKITALAVALTMGCSVVAFAACDPEGNGEGDGDQNPNVGVLPAGTPAQAIDAGFTSALEDVKEYLTVSYTNKSSGTDKYYTKKGGVENITDTTTYEINMSASGKFDLTKGDADLVAKSEATYDSLNKDIDFSYELAANNFIEYDFLRSWNMFSYKTPDNKEVTDFTGKEFEYDGSAKIDWQGIFDEIGSVGNEGEIAPVLPDVSTLPQTGELVRYSLLGENIGIVRLAAAANTIETVEGGYSIDLIKTVETVLKEFGSVIYALKSENTVGDVLNNAIVKKYFSVITELVPVEAAKDAFASAIDELANNETIAPLMLYIKQDVDALKTIEASDTYDYIVSIISSQNLVNILNTVATIAMQGSGSGAAPVASAPSQGVASGAFFTKTLDKYTVNEILSTVNAMVQPTLPITIQFLQNAYETYIESICDGEKLYVDSTSNNLAALTKLSVEYKVDGGKLTSQKISYAFEQEYTLGIASDSGSGESTNAYRDTKETQEGTLEITYATEAYALKDISGNVVNYTEYVWDESDMRYFEVYDEEESVQGFNVGAIIVEGEYTGYKVYEADKTTVKAEGNEIFNVGNIQYRVVEKDKYDGGYGKNVNFDVEIVDAGVVQSISLFQKEVNRSSTVAEFIAAK